ETLRPTCGIGIIRHSEVGPPSDHVPAQRLVADQSQEVRIADRSHRLAAVLPALTSVAMARGTSPGEDRAALFLVSGPGTISLGLGNQVRRRFTRGGLNWPPARFDAFGQDVDLLDC